jgi:hypothetical protein
VLLRFSLGLILGAALVCLSACGASARHTNRHRPATPAVLKPQSTPAFGLTEDNADLLWAPGGSPAPISDSFKNTSRALQALHPTYVRLLVNWAVLQPNAASPPALEGAVDGCARQVGPCGAYAGIRDELAAIASEQRATGKPNPGAQTPEVVIDIFGVPPWAARAASGCEPTGTAAFSRPVNAAGIAGYRGLIRSLLALAARQGVTLEWWTPWNEPNSPVFISPQRSSCAPDSPPASPTVYVQLVRAMAAELKADGAHYHLLLGELAEFLSDSAHRMSITRFVAALPADVICLSDVWSVHAYARRDQAALSMDPVGTLEAALDAHGACGRSARIWVTETGAGAPRPGRPRPAGSADERAGCLALAQQLIRWHVDPRVSAVLQYTFREDPAFPVGLISADLSHLYRSYALWLAWSKALAAGGTLPADLPGACA